MTTFTGLFSAGVVTFDAVCASLPPDRVARTATTTTRTKKPPVSTSASRIGLKPGRFLISQAPNQSHIRLSTLSQANGVATESKPARVELPRLDRSAAGRTKRRVAAGNGHSRENWEDWVPTFSWQPALVSSPFRVRAPRDSLPPPELGVFGDATTPAIRGATDAPCLQAFLGWAVKDSNLRPWD